MSGKNATPAGISPFLFTVIIRFFYERKVFFHFEKIFLKKKFRIEIMLNFARHLRNEK